MDQARQAATKFAIALQQIYLNNQKQVDVASLIEPLLPALEHYAPRQEIQTHLDNERNEQIVHQERITARRRLEIAQFALYAPKFP